MLVELTQLASLSAEAANGHSQWQQWLNSSVKRLADASLLRSLHPVCTTLSPVEVDLSSVALKEWLDSIAPSSVSASTCFTSQASQGSIRLKLFSLNDYMGLSQHPAICRAAGDTAVQCGMGPRSSALVGGYTRQHQDLEASLATLKGTEDCLLFSSGFAANLAVVSALCQGPDAVIFSDELNHASIIDGCRLATRSKGALQVYRHNDMAHLEELLQACPASKRKLVITDSLFSMDGDFADLHGLVALRRRYGFALALDEAHATLVAGDRGGGAAEMFGVASEVDIHIGTLSKGFGSHGGFVAGSSALKSFLMNRGRSYVFSTALPLPAVAAAQAAIIVCQQEPQRRQNLWDRVQQLGDLLRVAVQSPIIPLVVGDEAAALAASALLLRKGFHVPAIRPPTVPKHTSRLPACAGFVSVCLLLTQQMISGALQLQSKNAT
ncbi:hypothetical protein ABBQ32_005735 [Trebouxia sp. C0010 RCD-2024]